MALFDPIRVGSSASGEKYQIERSIRISRDKNSYFSISNGGDTRTFTFSCWIKMGKLSSHFGASQFGGIYSQYLYGSNRCGIVHTGVTANSAGLQYQNRQNNSHKALVYTEEKIRDHSAWIHLVIVMNTPNSTRTDRFIVYENGRRMNFDYYSGPVQNSTSKLNSSTTHYIGQDGYYGSGDFYLADIHLIDGQAYDASYFGETDATTGEWIPIEYTGGYTGSSYHLTFSDNSSVSALGTDSSGLGNNVTPHNFDVGTGDSNDCKTDTPTNSIATLNPQTGFTNRAHLQEGNLKMTGSSGFKDISTIAFPGTSKFYYELVRTNAAGWQLVGVFVGQPDNPSNALTNSAIWGFASTQATYFGGSYTSTNNVPGWGNNDVMGIKYENGTLKLYKNGTLASASTSSIPTDDIVFAYIANDNTNAASYVRFNSDDWTQDSAAGVDETWALSKANLPDPGVTLSNKHFDILLWTGTGSTHNITGLDFQPDWVWVKKRSGSESHELQDAVRGATKRLSSNSSGTESTANGSIDSFNSDGITVDDAGMTNESGYTYVGWFWNAGDSDSKTYTVKVVSDSGNKYRFDDFGTSAVTLDLAEGGTYIFDQSDSSNSGHPLRFSTTSNGTHGGGSEYTTGVTTSGTPGSSGAYTQIVVAASAPTLYYYCTQHSGMGGQANTNSTLGSSNFDGTRQAVVKANPTAGFSVGTFTAQSSGSATVGHGLGVAPDVVITKSRTAGSNWYTFHKDIGKDGWTLLDGYAAFTTGNSAAFGTDPTSSVWTYGSGLINQGDIVFYAFTSIEGFSKFGEYTGNGNNSGTFVYTGFKPALVITRGRQGTSWYIFDNKRNPYNPVDIELNANNNQSDSGTGTDWCDFLSNGFKLRTSNSAVNYHNNYKYIYLAFAEIPFKYARGI